MTPTFECRIDIEPVAKERPRFNRKTGTTYTPKKTADFEKAVAFALRRAGAIANSTHFLEIHWRFGATDWTRKDADNVLKACLDAGNSVLYADDSQVKNGRYELEYGVAEPYIECRIFVLGSLPEKKPRKKKIQKRVLPTGFDVCPKCGKGAKLISQNFCRKCASRVTT